MSAAGGRTAADRAIFRLAVEGIADRMQDVLLRAAVSVVAREGMDCAAALFLPDGRVLAQARSLPLLLGGMIPAVAGLLAAFPAARMRDGDSFLQNDPWSGGTHLPDLIVLAPVRHEGRTVALAATILHHQDVGGIAAGSVPPDARDIFQEGIRIPPVRWRSRGQEDAAVRSIVRANSRAPDILSGDLSAQWAAASLGARETGRRVAALGGAGWDLACEGLVAEGRQATERALGALPDGEATVSDALESDGLSEAAVPLRVRLCKSGGRSAPRLEVDFDGSGPQTAGPVNAVPSGLVAALFSLLRQLAPEAPANAGMLEVATLRLPEGSVVNPRWPAPVNARTATVKIAANAMLAALARLDEGRGAAPNAAVAVVLSMSGVDAAGRSWFVTEIVAGGAGAGPDGPGPHATSTDVSNARNLPAEILEAQGPVQVEEIARRRGSGGRGRHPGGDGTRRVYRLLHGTAEISYRGERHRTRTSGSAGGGEGAPAAARLERADGTVEHLPSKARVAWRTGDRLVVETAGGGGWGELPETGEDP